MKKPTLAVLVLVAGSILGHSQGAINIANTAPSYLIFTNTGTPQVSGTVGAAGTGPNSYYYAVLAAPYGGAAPGTTYVDLANTALWTYTGVIAANDNNTKGGVAFPNTETSAQGTFGLPTGGTYSTAPTEYYIIVGWSANLGTSWATVANELAGNYLSTGVWFGTSPVAYNEAGGGPDSLNAVNLLNGGSALTGLAGSGLANGFDLYQVVPEPTTIALAGLGGLTLLAFRRKKA